MLFPQWTGWKKEEQGEDDYYVIGKWTGAFGGHEVSVPCIYTKGDVDKNTPAQLEELKALLRKNGLDSWYHLVKEYQYGA